jgi:hypothetical protein
MTWLFWQLNTKAGTNPPAQWLTLMAQLRGVLPRKDVEKIELVAFSIKGKRTARRLLNTTNPEYCTETEALKVAKKLAWLTLLSRDPPQIEPQLRPLLSCDKTQGCKLLIGHTGNCITTGNPFSTATRCALCGKQISIGNFNLNGRRDPNSITVNHRTPLSRTAHGQHGHNAENRVSRIEPFAFVVDS